MKMSFKHGGYIYEIKIVKQRVLGRNCLKKCCLGDDDNSECILYREAFMEGISCYNFIHQHIKVPVGYSYYIFKRIKIQNNMSEADKKLVDMLL